jgi:endoglucanase
MAMPRTKSDPFWLQARRMCLSSAVLACATAATAQIHVNRLGFSPDESKSFVAAAVPGDGFFWVIDENGTQAFQGTLSPPLADPLAGERVQRDDFSELTCSGIYRIRLSDGTVSGNSPIANNVLRDLYRHAVHGLYLSRCGYVVIDDRVGHPACHTRDGKHRIEGGRKIRGSAE